MRYLPSHLWVGNTDFASFEYLASRAVRGVVDEVNFWQPKSQRRPARLDAGEPFLFRLKKPHHAIAGFGFFSSFSVIDLDMAWATFGWKNGDPDKSRFFERIGRYRRLDLLDPSVRRAPLGCVVLRAAHFWPRERWIPWRRDEGWHDNTVQGATVRDPALVARLLTALRDDVVQLPDDLADGFTPLDVDERQVRLREAVTREGQGAFRLRLLDAYGGQCAITGEHTVPVLDAAHIQPYLGAQSNHVQNGILLTKELHTLFDCGYVGVTPDYVVRVSERLRADYGNGRRYYPYDDRKLVHLPADPAARPSRDALAWHFEQVFSRTG